MGAGLYIVAQSQTAGVDTFVNGKFLAQAGRKLDALAKKAKVRPLMEFFSVAPDELQEFAEGEGAQIPAGGSPAEEWSTAQDGLVSVRGMLACLTEHPNAIADADHVAADLREFEQVLLRLESAGVPWHLGVDF